MLHVASHTDGSTADLYLSRMMEEKKVSIHPFHTGSELLTLAQRFTLDMIYIGLTKIEIEPVVKALDLIRLIKHHTYLAIIPTVLYHPQPADSTVLAAYENGVEEVFSDAMQIRVAKVKAMMLMQRAGRDLSINPSSRLPGPGIIEKEIERQIELGQEFAVGYVDLDNFKAFNDYYGYYYGDRVIRLTSRIIKDVVFDVCWEGFVGHIGGDDFIFIIPGSLVPPICEGIIRTFDTIIPFRYKPEDRRRGFIVTHNRRREEETFGIMTLSIAVVINKGKMFQHVGEMSHMLADLKKYAKSLEGSNYVIERRKKY